MKRISNNQASSTSLSRLRRMVASCSAGVVCGALIIPLLHRVLYGDADPLRHTWPLLLQASAFLTSLIIANWFRCATAVAPGVYVGLVGLMLVSGESEYPMSSAIGLSLHAFIPAALGAALAFFGRRLMRPSAG